MLKRFEVRNYKNFKESISIDFSKVGGYQFSTNCITNNMISKMLIYGRNATGKTNLGNAIMDIYHILSGWDDVREGRVFLNANSNEEYADFSYEFVFDGEEILYKYSKNSNQELVHERLSINNKQIFRCDFNKREFSFDNLDYLKIETINTERYILAVDVSDNQRDIQRMRFPFFRWVINNAAFQSDSVLLKVENYVKRMSTVTASGSLAFRWKLIVNDFFELLDDEKELKSFVEFLNVMGVECKLVLKNLPDGQKELYFKYDKLVPFYVNASSGTRALVHLYFRFIVHGRSASFMYIDEFDAFYHYEMAENLIKYFKEKCPKCQMILTSHNTNLMTNRLMRPDCLFILSREGKLTALCDATMRELREGHNLEKMYISGEFEKYE